MAKEHKPKFQIFVDEEGLWRWRFRAGNGEIMAASEAYVNKRNCKVAVLKMIELFYWFDTELEEHARGL